MPTIGVQHLTKQFRGTAAVDALSTTVHDGEFFIVIRPAGCGKTTLLKLVAGLLSPDDGEGYFDHQP